MTVAAPDMGGRAGKILDRFPSFMLAPSPDKVLASIAVALGGDLDECERLASRIQRSHRLAVADEAGDVLRLAALAALHPADFFILAALQRGGLFAKLAEQANADALAAGDPAAEPSPLPADVREQRGYDAYVDALREAVARTVAVLMDGCGTVRALLAGTAVLLDADPLVPGGEIEAVDTDPLRGGFVHRMGISHHVVTDGEPGTSEGGLVLVENPLVDRATDDVLRGQRERFLVVRGGFYSGPATIQITGTGRRTVGPMMINNATHEGVSYAGALEDGQTLTFTTDGKALLDGVDVTARACYFRGALADDPQPAARRGGQSELPSWHRRSADVSPLGGLDRSLPGEPVTPLDDLPVIELPIGESQWRFSVREGAFDAARFDEAVHPLPTAGDPAQPASAAASGRVKLSWTEHDPFAVTVLIPPQLASLEQAGLVDGDLPTLVRAGLERFRAAGIRLDVRYASPDWILGAGGLDVETTVLPDPAPIIK
jgi:hypothetical protein